MQAICKPIALLGLAITTVAPLLLFAGAIKSLDTHNTAMFVGMVLWFLGGVPWLAFDKEKPSDLEVEI